MRHLQEPILAVFLGNCLVLRKASPGSAFKYLKKKSYISKQVFGIIELITYF